MSRKIFIVSLPKHATTSTETFLARHGITLSHNGKLPEETNVQDHWHPQRMVELHRHIAAGNFDMPLIDNHKCEGMSGYPASSHYRELARQYPDALFVHITRDKDTWLDSATEFLNATAQHRDGNQPLQDAFTFFRKGAFGGLNPKTKAEFSEGYDRHYNDMEKFAQEVGPNRFIAINVKDMTDERGGPDRLCEFIGIERDPAVKFTVETKHADQYVAVKAFKAAPKVDRPDFQS